MHHRRFNHTGVYVLLLLLGEINRVSAYTVSDATSLHTTLSTNYNKNVLPDYPVHVRAEFNLMTVNSLDLTTQTLSTSGWFTVIWTDSRLSWTAASHGNIDHLYMSQNQIWHPELIIGNSVTDLTCLGDDDLKLKVTNTGEVQWEPAAILSTSCDMDVTFFPYDLQTCDIELTSWGFHTDAVNLTFDKLSLNLQDYRTNGEWDLISTSQHTSMITEGNLTYSDLIFRIVMERLPGHYIMSVIFPVILTSVLTAITFILPVESGEKVGYILTVLLALAVLLTLFADNMPTTSKHTSVLVLYLTVTLGLASLVIILTVLIIRLYHKRDDYKVPDWTYRFVHKCRQITRNNNSVSSVDEDKGSGVINQNDKVNWKSKDNTELQKLYSNKDIAQFCDNFFFLVFVILYVIVSLVFTITLSVAG